MTASHDIFRFNAIRGVQNASAASLKGRVIFCDLPGISQGTLTHIPQATPAPTREEAIAAAQAQFDSGVLSRGLKVFTHIPIELLDVWLSDRDDRVSPAKVKAEVLAQTGSSVQALRLSSEYRDDRLLAASLLSAAALLPTGTERARIQMIRAMHIFGLIEELAVSKSRIRTSAEVFSFLAFAVVVLPRLFPTPATALSRPPAIADLKVVRQKLLRYETGEIAHIENVLKGESKSRAHRRRDFREETQMTDSERETLQEHELETSERFEMQQEATRVVSDEMRLQAGATISASYGPTVSATITGDFEMNHSEEESKRSARNFAREVTERSANSIKERTRAQRTLRTINEVEETNTHGLDNKDGTGHVIGVYRYVEKVYQAQVYNYGKRLMLEFIVPEPSSFIRQLMDKPIVVDMEQPNPPTIVTGTAGMTRRLAPADITPKTYMDWVGKYFVQEVVAPPEETVWVPLAWDLPAQPDTGITDQTPARKIYKVNQTLEIPQGYKATEVSGIIGVSDYQDNVMIAVGDAVAVLTKAHPLTMTGAYQTAYKFKLALTNSPIRHVPVGLVIENCWGYEITLNAKCVLQPEGLQKWQMETFNKVMQAYFELKSMYDEKVAAAKIQRGVSFDGRNTAQNRRIERTELKKHVITMLERNNFDKPPVDQSAIDYTAALSQGFNEINFAVAEKERQFIQWFEQAFEWQNMTYVFYPYYWSKKHKWIEDALGQDTDPIFNDFLRAGAARVVVPVRQRFEKAMGLYLASGIIWNGNQAPQVGDRLFISAVQELQEQLGAPDEGKPEGTPWTFTLPTPLVILQERGEL